MEGKGIRLPEEGHFVALADSSTPGTVTLSFRPPKSSTPLVIDGVKRKEVRLVILADDADTLATGILIAAAEARALEGNNEYEDKE